MAVLFDSFKAWKAQVTLTEEPLYKAVLDFEVDQKGKTEDQIWEGMMHAYAVMKDAVKTGLEEDMTSRSGMINNGGKRVYNSPVTVLSPEFKKTD